MSRVAIILSIIAMISASSAQAEFRTVPGGTTEIAVQRIGCFITVDGKKLINGTCLYRLTDSADVLMTLPESATQISVNVSRRRDERRAVRLWAQTPDGKQHREFLGYIKGEECQRPNEYIIMCPCWANQRVRICSWSLQTPPETQPRSPDEAYSFPSQQPPAPPSPSEQQAIESMERFNRMLEKHTQQPPVR